MFLGHYACAFVLKKKVEQIPLWLLFLSVQLVDILAFLFILLGVERIAYNPSPNPFLRTSLEYIPYSHSLFTNVIFALITFLFFWKFKNIVWGLILSLGVLSHWFLDVIVHVRDMPLFFNNLKTGLGLWNFPWVALVFEMMLLILAGHYFIRSSTLIKKYVALTVLLLIAYLTMFFAPEAEATPIQVSIISLLLYSVFTGLAYWAERKK